MARKRVEDTEISIEQEQEDMRNAEKAVLTTTKPETTFAQMLNAIGDSLSDLASPNDGEDGEDEDDDQSDPELGKLSEDDEPGCVMGTISETIKHHKERFQQKQMKLHKLTQPGWGDPSDLFRERDKKHGMTAFKVQAVVQPQTADNAASSALTTVGEPMETLDSVPGKSQIPHLTSRPRTSHMRLCSWKHQTHECIPSLPPPSAPASSTIQKSKQPESVNVSHCRLHRKLITI